MQKQENDEKPLDAAEADEDKKLKTPHNIPVANCISEARDLYQWLQGDKEALQASGLDWELVEDLPKRIDALANAEVLWHTQWIDRQTCSREWNARYPLGYELRNRLLNDFRFAFRKQQVLLVSLKAILGKNNHATMIQGLLELSILGRANLPLLEAIGFDVSLLDQAAQFFEELGPLLAKSIAVRKTLPGEKKERDLAYTRLKEAVDEIRQAGQYAFRDVKERRRGYVSDFLRQKKIRQTRKAKQEQQEKE